MVNKTIADNLVHGGLIKQTFTKATELLDEMTKIHKFWYKLHDIVTPLTLGMTKKQIKKNQELDKNMAKVMT